MGVVFALVYSEGVSPVKVSLRDNIPLAGSPEADKILGVEKRKAEPAAKRSGDV